MVIRSRFVDHVVLTTAVALVLAALSFSMPWYSVNYERVYEGRAWQSGELIFYPDFANTPWGAYYYSDLGDEPVAPVFDKEFTIVAIWLFVGLLFLFACLRDSRSVTFVLAWIVIALAILSVVWFVARISPAIYSFERDYVHMPPEVPLVDGFMDKDTDVVTGSSTSYGPSSGFLTVLSAAAIQVLSALIRLAAIVPPIMKDRRELRRVHVEISQGGSDSLDTVEHSESRR